MIKMMPYLIQNGIAPRSLQNVDTLKEYLINGGYDKLAESISKSNCPLR